jgi:hypothetical protein
MDLIWVKREGIYLCDEGWTGSISLIGKDKFRVWRKGDGVSRHGDFSARHFHRAKGIAKRVKINARSRASGGSG